MNSGSRTFLHSRTDVELCNIAVRQHDFAGRLLISGAGAFARENPDSFAALNDVLGQTRETYARTRRVFEFVIRE